MHCMGKGGELRVPEQPSQVLKPGGDAGTQQVWGQDSPSWGWAAPKGSGRLGPGSQAVLRGSPRTGSCAVIVFLCSLCTEPRG